MSEQQLGKCTMLPYEVWPNLLLKSLVHIDSAYSNPKGIVSLLCWCWDSLSDRLQACHSQVLSNIQLSNQCSIFYFGYMLLNMTGQWHEFEIFRLCFIIWYKQTYWFFFKRTSFSNVFSLIFLFISVLSSVKEEIIVYDTYKQ